MQDIFNRNSVTFANSTYAKFLQSTDANSTMKLVYPAASEDPKEFPSNSIIIHPLKAINEKINGHIVHVTAAMMITNPYKYVYLPFYEKYHSEAVY
ncbi:hypothetical protein IKS57_01470 [bacterium]|nr:hypothetical protein [bacterium]